MKAHITQFIHLLLWFLLPATVCGQVNFSADTTSGCGPLTVQFTADAPGATNVFWDFGDNSSSINQDPIKVYTQPGVYTISLRAVYASGAPIVTTKTAFIQVFGPPVAHFTSSIQQICAGTPIIFLDNSTQGTGNITQWQWNFGDGRVSSQTSPIHTYRGKGVFTVSLEVIDVNGCSDIFTRPFHIKVDKPDATFSYNNIFDCSPPLTSNFTSRPNPNSTHVWLFGTGSSTQINPSYTFISPGLFNVLHIVTDANGCADTAFIRDLVQVGQLNVQVRSSKSKACIDSPIQFFCGSNLTSSVSWNFGPAGTSNVCNPIVSFSTPGTYTINATLSFPNGCVIDGSTTVDILALPDISFYTPDTFACDPPLISNFTSTVAHAPAGSFYLWDFGDRSFPSNVQNPTHTYRLPGTFDVSLTVVTPDGCRDSIVVPKLVYIDELIPRFGAIPNEGCLPLDVDFADYSYSSSPITSLSWDFGNGLGGIGGTPSSFYPLRGDYTVKLYVENRAGCKDTLIKDPYVYVGDSVKANFGPRDTTTCGGLALQYLDSSSGNITKWTWLFGDGNMKDSLDPLHQFTDTGFLSVMLVVSDNGCKDTLEVDSAIYVKPVIASVGGLFIGCDTPFVATFFNSSKGGHIWHWKFGTGNSADTSNLKDPQFVYYQEGSYLASLIAIDTTTGCIDSMRRTVQVETIDLLADIDTSFGCAPLFVNFSGTSSHAIAQRWSFGDGIYANTINANHRYKQGGTFTTKLQVWNSIGCTVDSSFEINSYQPNVSFHVQDTNGCAPFTPVWTNTTGSPLPITRWQWDLGNVSTANTFLPSPTYSQGIYSVKLVATDSLGCSDSLYKRHYIFATEPKASFTVNDTINCIGKPIIFRSTSTAQTLFLTDWNFGDNMTSPVPVAIHSYAANGLFNATLTVTDSIGCESVANQQILIQDPDVTLSASATTASCPPLLVNFGGSVNSQHTFVRWEWDFGDGNTSNSQSPTYIYTRPGVFTVTLRAYSSTGCVDSVVLVDYITVLGPDGILTFSPMTGCPGTDVSFSVVDSNTVNSSCDFGDGTLIQGMPRLTNFNRIYQTPGVYKPILLLDDGNGCVLPIVSKDSIVIFPDPQANFTAQQTSVCNDGTIQFLDLSTSPSAIASWFWKFGDGQVSALPSPSHYYAQPDSYTVTLIVTTLDGCMDSLELPDFIIVRELPDVGMTLSDTAGCQPFTLRLSDNSPLTNALLTNWEWKSGYAGGQANGSNVQFDYPAAGLFTVNLQITDVYGCQNDLDSTIRVLPPPIVDFGVLPDSFGCAPVVLQFRDRVRSGANWRWDFGDGNASLQQDPQHEYAQDGFYDVKFVVIDSRGCSDSLTKPAYIRLGHPNADFTFAPDEGCPPLLVDFSDITLSDTSLSSYQWDFGDANTGTGTNPQHTYMQAGVYTVRLIVHDVFGCADTLTKENIIRVRDDIQPNPSQIRRVTVLSDAGVRVEWEGFVNLNSDFGRYEIYREDAGNWVQVFTSNDISKTYFDDTGLNTPLQSYCYKLLIVNNCENISLLDSSNTHCSILLATSALPESIQLNWSAYVGFEVAAYQIYRVTTYAMTNAELIATVGPETLSYLDTDMFCYDQVTYRIQADKVGESLHSFSNISSQAPIHQAPNEREDLVRATVEDNQWIKVEWKNLGIERAETFVLERNEGTGYRNVLRLPASQVGNSFQDDNVEVQLKPYLYRAYWEDSCGDRTNYGLSGSSIHLAAERKQGTVFLDWTSYKRWNGGVATYQIELLDQGTGAFMPVARVQPSDTAYQDRESDLQQGSYCYRIRAFEQGGNDTISISNEACVNIFPQIYAPNAFSPNGDGYNETFLIKGAYLQTFTLRIFTRWGYKIFESHDQNEGWNGRFKEEDSPEGVYVFVAEAIGLDGSPVHLQGTVTLIR